MTEFLKKVLPQPLKDAIKFMLGKPIIKPTGRTCLICGSKTFPFFSKIFNSHGLTQVEYNRCPKCEFVFSRTHQEMSAKQWNQLNDEYHSAYQGANVNADDPNWIPRLTLQADVIADLVQLGIMTWRHALDYGCGDGKLSDILKERSGLDLGKFDQYMDQSEKFLTEKDLLPGTFDFVITTSVFEHLLTRSDFDFLESLVSKNGVLGLHTMACEEIPLDPNWFYLLPVHVAFFSNKSMEILFRKWGYGSCIYHRESHLWFWFKRDQDHKKIERLVNKANSRIGKPKYFYKKGFVDFWQYSLETVRPKWQTAVNSLEQKNE